MKKTKDNGTRMMYNNHIGIYSQMAKTSKAQLKAQQKYDSVNTVHIALKLNRKTDADILDKLEAVANKQGYIKDLIRDDIKREEE